jgi:hypothetical protein
MAQLALGATLQFCVLLDLSQTGARVHLGSAQEVPEKVVLCLPDGSIQDAYCRWQRDAEVGLEFSVAA